MPPHLMVIIPAYNEEASVGDVVRAVRRVAPEAPVMVIDDGSSDGTSQAARDAGAELLRLPHHLGLGGAVQTGYRFAFEHGYDCVVRVDSDGQHNPADIRLLLDKLLGDGFDMVTGSRYLAENGYPRQWLRRLGSQIFSLLLYPILGKRITDPTSGFAAVNRRALEVFSRSFPLEYPEIEALVVLQRKALRFCEVPVKMFPRRSGRSTIGSAQAIYYMFRVLLGVLVNVIKYERRFHPRPKEQARG
ncbi:MAG: glycosyltransferase family 2 protein [Acidobacteria bacterium]|nr:glycosyltransferase family 2 protein [Acidobacteriota bacterium]